LAFSSRFEFIRTFKQPANIPVMVKNYFKIAWRNLVKNQFSSSINIGGLAVGMTVALLIGLWIHDELSFDTYHANYNRIARVMQQQTANGIVSTNQAIPLPLATELQTHYHDDFKYVVVTSWMGDHVLKYGDKMVSQSGMYMQQDAARMLTLKMVEGNYDGLKDMHSILLSATAAKTFFGNDDPLNKVLRIDNNADVKVTGVYKDLPNNTQFNKLTFIGSFELYVANQPWIQNSKNNWHKNSFQLFVQMADNFDLSTVNKKIVSLINNHLSGAEKQVNPKILLHPMSDWHSRSHWDDNGVQSDGLIQYVWLFGIIGVFVLLLACINFMNLSTAQSEKRAKEVGIRKAIGSVRSQLIRQFYVESLLIIVFAFLLSILLLQLSLPWFNDLSNKQMSIPWSNSTFWIMAGVFIIITNAAAGSYPALYLSSFQPLKVLKGTWRAGRFASMPRKILVVMQFTISLALIIGTVVVYRQVQYAKGLPMGYNINGLMMIEMKSKDFYSKYDLLRNDLKSSGAIQDMAESSSPVTGLWSNDISGFDWVGKDPSVNADFAVDWITHDFGNTIGWKIKEGRDFSKDFKTDTSAIIMNEIAAKFTGIKNPVGSTIQWNKKNYIIIGVVKDMVMNSPYEQVKQTMYVLDYSNVNWMVLKLNPNRSADESISNIEAVYKKYIPSAPFDYKFADEEFEKRFDAEERIGKLSAFFATFAIFTSCLGLLGLTFFVAEQRKKEISIRKVLGASATKVWFLLSKEFVLLVLISFFIAIPTMYYFMKNWLQNYQHRAALSWWIFAAAGAGVLVITVIIISFQSIKAALANPVNSLRSE